MNDVKWSRVSPQSRCQQCQKSDWCTYSLELGVYCCMRIQSSRPAKNGGWLHDIDADRKPAPVRKSERPPLPVPNIRLTLEAWRNDSVGNRHISVLAKKLGVSESALNMLGCVHSDQFMVWAFPMSAGDGSIIGVRLRHENGKKWAMPGSHNGLFIPCCTPQLECVICEGPTDTAAALTIGMFAIGRPSCSGGVDHLIAALRRLKVRRVTIIADVDQDQTDKNGRDFNPGIDGARKLAELLPVASRIVTIPAKDLRQFVIQGGDCKTFNCIASQLVWNRVK